MTEFSRKLLLKAEAEAKKLNHPLLTIDHVYIVILKNEKVIDLIERFGGNGGHQKSGMRGILKNEKYLEACKNTIETNNLGGTHFADGFTLPAGKMLEELIKIAEERVQGNEPSAVDFFAAIFRLEGSEAYRQIVIGFDSFAFRRRYLGITN